HWNAGSANLSSPEELKKGAELNKLAALRSKDSSVYDLALSFAGRGLKLLNAKEWKNDFELLKTLNLICAECEYILGNFDAAENLFQQLLTQINVPLEKARI